MDRPPQEPTLLKCIVLGSSNVGKTSLLNKFVHDKFSETRQATMGADFASKVVSLDEDTVVRMVIWDTAGQERFHHGTLGNAFYRGADAAILVYDTTDIRTFEQIELWRGELLQRVEGEPDDFPVLVVGNKVDLPSETREEEQAAVVKWCRDLGIGLCLTSAKDGMGVTDAMHTIAALALDNKRRRLAAAGDRPKQQSSSRGALTLDSARHRDQNSSSCCK